MTSLLTTLLVARIWVLSVSGGHNSPGNTCTVSGVCFQTMGAFGASVFSLDKAFHLVLKKAELSVFQG